MHAYIKNPFTVMPLELEYQRKRVVERRSFDLRSRFPLEFYGARVSRILLKKQLFDPPFLSMREFGKKSDNFSRDSRFVAINFVGHCRRMNGNQDLRIRSNVTTQKL